MYLSRKTVVLATLFLKVAVLIACSPVSMSKKPAIALVHRTDGPAPILTTLKIYENGRYDYSRGGFEKQGEIDTDSASRMLWHARNIEQHRGLDGTKADVEYVYIEVDDWSSALYPGQTTIDEEAFLRIIQEDIGSQLGSSWFYSNVETQ